MCRLMIKSKRIGKRLQQNTRLQRLRKDCLVRNRRYKESRCFCAVMSQKFSFHFLFELPRFLEFAHYALKLDCVIKYEKKAMFNHFAMFHGAIELKVIIFWQLKNAINFLNSWIGMHETKTRNRKTNNRLFKIFQKTNFLKYFKKLAFL